MCVCVCKHRGNVVPVFVAIVASERVKFVMHRRRLATDSREAAPGYTIIQLHQSNYSNNLNNNDMCVFVYITQCARNIPSAYVPRPSSVERRLFRDATHALPYGIYIAQYNVLQSNRATSHYQLSVLCHRDSSSVGQGYIYID